MNKNSEMTNGGRKAWKAPELRRLQAGSAEAGTAQVADGGNPQAARS